MMRIAAKVVILAVASGFAADPQSKARTDLAGDPLPDGAIARLGTTRFRPHAQMSNAYFSPDAKTVIGLADSTLYFWETATGKTIDEVRDADLYNVAADQSPDGKLLAMIGSDRRGKPSPDIGIRVYDLATRQVLWTKVLDDEYHPHGGRVQFSRDGKTLITGGYDLRLWDSLTGRELRREKLKVVGPIVLSPDGKTLAIAGQAGLHLWDWELDAPPRFVDTGMRKQFYTLAFARNGTQICTSEGYERFVYDVVTGKRQGRADEALFAWRAISPDGKTVASPHYDIDKRAGSVVLSDTVSGKETGRLSAGLIGVGDGRWAKDGSRLVGKSGYRAWVWDVASGKVLGTDLPGHFGQINDVFFTSDGRLWTNSLDRTVCAWNPATGKLLSRMEMPSHIARLAGSRDGSLLAAGTSPSSVAVWETKDGRKLFDLRWSTRRDGGVFNVAFAADDQRLLTYSSDWYLRIWDTLTGKLKSERRYVPDAVQAAKGDPDEEERQSSNWMFALRVGSIGPDGETFAFVRDKCVSIYDIGTGKERLQIALDGLSATTVQHSPDGKRVAICGVLPMPKVAAQPADRKSEVIIWDIGKGEQVSRFRVPLLNYVVGVAFSPDGKQLATTSSNETLCFWDTATGKQTGTITLPHVPQKLAFADGNRLAVSFFFPSVLVYDLKSAVKPAVKE